MRTAITKGTLRIPPTYFALAHAAAMPDIEWRAFTLVADIADPAVAVPVEQATPLAGRLGARARERLKWGRLGTMARAVEAWGPDVVHQQQATWSLPAVRASRRTGAPMVTTLHGGDAYRAGAARGAAGGAWNERNRRAAFAQSEALLAVSRFLAGVAVASGAPADKVEVHYQGVDTEFWTPGDPSRRADAEPTVLFVGALTALKGVMDLAEVSAALVERFPHRLVVVGEGPLEERVRAAAGPHVRMTGALPREWVRDLVRSAAVLVCPTRSSEGRQEAAGLVLLEAQACAVPVIAGRVGGTPEMLADSATGFLTADGDRDDLAAALGRVLAMPEEERAAMGAAAREWVVGNRSLRGATARLREVYASLG